MNKCPILKNISNISKVLMVLLVTLMIIAMSQGIIVGISQIAMMSKYRLSQQGRPEPIEDEITRIKRSQKRFMPDGTVHQLLYEETGYYQEDAEKKLSIYDANDKRIWQGLQKNLSYKYLSWPGQTYSSTFERWQLYSMLTFNPDFSRSIEFPVRQNGEIKIIWRYLPEKEYFIAYDLTGGIAGYLGTTGFTKQKSNVTGLGKFGSFYAWCPEGSNNPVMLWQTDKKIYRIDFQKQYVKLIFQNDKELKEQMLFKNWRFTKSDDANDIKYRPAVLLQTVDGNHHLVMRRPDQTFTFTPPPDWDLEEQNIALTATEDNIYLLRSYHGPKLPEEYKYSEKLVDQWWQQRRSKSQQYWQELYTVNEKGSLDLMNRYEWTVPPYKIEYDELGLVIGRIKGFVTEFSPPAYSIVWSSLYKYSSVLRRPHPDNIFYGCFMVMQELHSRRMIFNWSVSLVLVLIALWHGYSRRTNWLNLIIWLALVALFNIAGFLTYWALNHTTLIKCPVCGKKRHLEQPKCVRCGADLPSPQRKPTDLLLT